MPECQTGCSGKNPTMACHAPEVSLKQGLEANSGIKKGQQGAFSLAALMGCCYFLFQSPYISYPSEVLGVNSIPSIPVCSVQ